MGAVIPVLADLPSGWSKANGLNVLSEAEVRRLKTCPDTCVRGVRFSALAAFKDRADDVRVSFVAHAYGSPGLAKKVYATVVGRRKKPKGVYPPSMVITPMPVPALGDARSGVWISWTDSGYRSGEVTALVGTVVVTATATASAPFDPQLPPAMAQLIVNRAQSALSEPGLTGS